MSFHSTHYVPTLDFGDIIDWHGKHPFRYFTEKDIFFRKIGTEWKHKCYPGCIAKREEFTLKVHNPYLVPLKHGFLRVAVKQAVRRCAAEQRLDKPSDLPQEVKNLLHELNQFSNVGIKIVYVTPCGKTLLIPEHVRRYLRAVELDLDVDHFTFSPNFVLKKIVIENATTYVPDISHGLEDRTVSFINQVDGRNFNFNFSYVSRRIFFEQPSINLSEFCTSCDCEDDCSNLEACSCAKLTRYDNCGMTGYQHKRLMEKHDFGIYECNQFCRCSSKCLNRVAGNGVKCQMQVFASKHKGFGVRALHFIPRGTFVCAYNGQILTDDQANRVVHDQFLAWLDHIEMAIANASADRLPNEKQLENGQPLNLKRSIMFGQEDPYVVDGSRYTNLGRLFNHSCHPNMFTQNVFLETHDIRFSHIAFFTSRDISPLEELTWDYSWDLSEDASANKSPVYCNCQSLNCTFRLR